MNVNGTAYRSIWENDQGEIFIFDQTLLPYELKQLRLCSLEDACVAIRSMQVRGAPLIGAVAAYGLCLALADDASDSQLRSYAQALIATRPTAINLRWAVERLMAVVIGLPEAERRQAALQEARKLCDEDVATCSAIGDYGLQIIEQLAQHKAEGDVVNILTHCNAGWLATVDWGTALAPIYKAHNKGIAVHVWVDETRPRNQGAKLTVWELAQHGVPHTLIADNTGGHLMQQGMVDLCLVGTDRTTASGDVCNKIGTYLKALAAQDNQVPFYVGLPVSTIDWTLHDGVRDIPIEQRAASEVTRMDGVTDEGVVQELQITPAGTLAANYGFDVTPARLVTGLITEHGVYQANAKSLAELRQKLGSQ